MLDTSVLSAAFRRRRQAEAETPAAAALRQIISADQPVAVPGIVLQELLSGVRSEDQFQRLESRMEGFPVLAASREHHVSAARIANSCRGAGVSASVVDCLIAAQTIAAAGRLFTLDEDFSRIAPLCGLKLLRAASRLLKNGRGRRVRHFAVRGGFRRPTTDPRSC